MYSLASSDQEHRRLQAASERIRELLDEKIFHAPLDSVSIHRVIYMGCEIGAITDELGTTYSKAKICGVNLSPVPALRLQLKNIEYIQGGIMELAATEKNDRLTKDTFDYIFSKFLMGVITDWKKYIELCLGLARPGAWIEIQEPDMAYFLSSSSGNAYDAIPWS
ncbi:uncharacterized protein M421DRAFT_2200 [Didymella exigua CBS 183.55]|uniref:Methyltransferase type 11 domain-containing protein n=1 Tax=Didymella exigua CBS 183.55 TaxID=1150837 RepID=A0A6A5RZ52_9PLEO|nr:uncharacterized protein M421DRAFT_2200 [Didymella exigua CBS 183.55]KAF1931536.1 hypothetical protein M421DRAFT_2200 [Didymella exigua CBS 183.55]